MPWSHPQHLWSHPLFQSQSGAHLAMPASPLQTHEHEKEHAGPRGTESVSLEKSQPSSTADASGPGAGVGRDSFYSTSMHTNYDDLHNMGSSRPTHSSYPSGFALPMPPFPVVDPVMLYMHHMRRQAAYLYSMAGCSNGYQSPLPVLSPGACQRGFIKIPSGIPQKQAHLWESQSSENMQLWATITQLCATVSRAEAEMFCQRGKISKLEDDLEAMRTRQDALLEAVKSSTVSPQTRREKRKRTATVPVAILGLPAFQPLPVRVQVKKARGSMKEGESMKPTSMLVSKGNREQAPQNTTFELTNGSLRKGNENCTPGLNQSQSGTNSIDKDMADLQHSNIDTSGGDIIKSSLNENSSRAIVPEETMREISGLENMKIKQECITQSLTDEAEGSKQDGTLGAEKDETCDIQSCTKQNSYSEDCCGGSETMNRGDVSITNKDQERADDTGFNIKSGLTETGRGDNRLEGVVMLSTRDSSGGNFPSDGENLTPPNASCSGKVVTDWHWLLQNGQVGTSALLDKEAKAINACPLDGFDGADEWTKEAMEGLKL